MDVPSTMPKVSVIIVSHNRPALLRRSITSALSQDYSDFELIIVDDSSDSRACNVVNSFKDPRIRYTKLATAVKASAALNFGIKQAKGEFVAFLDDDDEWLPTKLSKQVKVFKEADDAVAIVYTGVFRIYGKKGGGKPIIPSVRGYVFTKLLEECFILTMSATMARTGVLLQIGGFDETMPAHHDLDIYLRIAKNYRFDFVPEALVNYYESESSITCNYKKQILGWNVFYSKYGYQIKSKKILSNYYLRKGVLLFLSSEPLDGRRCLVKSLQINWRNMKAIPLLGLSMMGSDAFKKIYHLFEPSIFASSLIKISDHGTKLPEKG
jgi:glycosyltransferase involved in cell wall biosynthesis